MTDPPPMSSTTLSKKEKKRKKKKNYKKNMKKKYVTRDMWHVTRDTWHVTCDTFGGVNIISKFQLPSSYRLWFMILWRYFRKRLTDLINQWMTRLFVGQPRLHRVCQRVKTMLFKNQAAYGRLSLWQCNLIYCIVLQFNEQANIIAMCTAVQCRAVQYSSFLLHVVRCSAVPWSVAPCSTVQWSSV